MSSVIYAILYNVLFIPVFYLALFLVSLFNEKVRKGFWGRFGLFRKLKPFLKVKDADKPILVLHCASMGEFEHTKPFLVEFKKRKPEYRIIVLFFSPSGFENVKSFEEVGLFLYSPHEIFFSIWRFMRKVKPSLWIVAKHDVWPNQIWFCHLFTVPLFLINASLHQQSSRLLLLTRAFHRSVYKYFTHILTVSETDRHNFSQLIGAEKCSVVGDTKYDQVIFRREESVKKEVIPAGIYKNRWTIVAGSTWPEDHQHLLPAFLKLLRDYENLLLIICPHEPTAAHIYELKSYLKKEPVILLSQLADYRNQRVVIIDRIGVLANIYSIAKVAYVGGSFRQNIHNVLEAAVYKIPVIFGPVNQNSHEAQLLKAGKGGWEVHNSVEIENQVRKFLINEIHRQESGWQAFRVVEKNSGATQRTVDRILFQLNFKKD
ncbi:MAG: hypothetical protein EH225_10385 [Calditrichaeota bacterium]|nr:hypothetical protein [Calditrichota bacterium]RQW00506.1 MAG: hypothetical protein EH225_10385 [Calditrichota bacterium]